MLPARNAWDRKPSKPKDLSQKRFRQILKGETDNRKADRQHVFGAFLPDGTLVGDLYLMDIARGIFHNAYLGYFMFNRHWRKGYAKEALRAVLDIAFRDVKLHRVEAGIVKTNRRSLALARSVGLRREGFSRRRIFLRGQWIDLVLYAGTCEEFGVRWKW
jgi:ribosomal-protein-alanine N-acetyltransferase